MKAVLLALTVASAAAFALAPLNANRPSAKAPALRAAAAVDVPVKSFTGEALGTESMQLRATKEGKDMYVVHSKYVLERRNKRAGTASTLTRAEVRGGGRKPYKQKGTGRARRGSTRSPLIVGGGVIFGPKPKNWANKKMNKKEAELAIGIAIQNKAKRLTVVDGLVGKLDSPKTKSVTELLANLGLDAADKTVVVVDGHCANLEKSTNNMPYLQLRLQDEITVTDMLWANQVVMSKPAFDWVSERYGASA